LQITTRASRQTFWVARICFPMAPSLEGERAGPLAKMLFGAKHYLHASSHRMKVLARRIS